MPVADQVAGRFSGHLRIRGEYREGGYTVLGEQSFRAPFHLSKPYWEGRALVVQVVNPTAGILSGDQLACEITAASGSSLLVSTPSATRVFTMREGEASSRQDFRVESGAWLEYAPEPLVPHRASRFRQTTRIEVAKGGEGFWADLFMPGRLARAEAWCWDALTLDLTLIVEGELCLREHWSQSGPGLLRLARLAGAAEGACLANLVVVSERLGADRGWCLCIHELNTKDLWVGVSALRGSGSAWSIRLVAADSIRLRDALAEIRRRLTPWLPRLDVVVRKY